MGGPFHRIRFTPSDAADATRSVPGPGPERGGVPSLTFSTHEAAARYYLSQALGTTAPAPLRGLAPAASHQPVPDLALKATQDLPTSTVALKFEQTTATVPVFGSQVVVELKKDRSLVGIDGDLAEPPATKFLPRLSQQQALGEIAKLTGAAAAELEANPAAAGHPDPLPRRGPEYLALGVLLPPRPRRPAR